MPADTVLSVRFEAQDVISAQRLRFVKSSRFKWLIGLWAVVMIALIAKLLIPSLMPSVEFNSWGILVAVAVGFALVISVFYWLAPWLDYTQNSIWRTPFTLRITNDHLLLSMEGRSKGVTVEWSRILKVDENSRAFILYMRGESNFLIIPKSIFTDPGTEKRFRKLLMEKSSFKK